MKDSNTKHGSKFTFNENVAGCFSDMLERSIPSYQLMRELTTMFIQSQLNECEELLQNLLVIDVGTSTGEVIHSVADQYETVDFIGLENSDSMIKESRERFKEFKNVKIKKHDLRNKFSVPYKADVIISSLTIQFTPIEYRLQILQNIYDNLEDGGMFIFIEKVIGSSAKLDQEFIDIYYDIKLQNGYSQEEINRKKFALEGVLVPVTAKWNEEMLMMSGFKDVDCFWRCLNFCGWVAKK